MGKILSKKKFIRDTTVTWQSNLMHPRGRGIKLNFLASVALFYFYFLYFVDNDPQIVDDWRRDAMTCVKILFTIERAVHA